MSVELIQKMSVSAFVLAGVLFAAAIAIFFLFNIPKVFGEVSGLTARKSIENIRQQNVQTGNKAYRPSPVNAERGKITDRITPSGKLETKTGNDGISVGTSKLNTSELENVSSETTVLKSTAAETTVLSTATGDTTVLDTNSRSGGNDQVYEQPVNTDITVEYEIGFAGSSEIIE